MRALFLFEHVEGAGQCAMKIGHTGPWPQASRQHIAVAGPPVVADGTGPAARGCEITRSAHAGGTRGRARPSRRARAAPVDSVAVRGGADDSLKGRVGEPRFAQRCRVRSRAGEGGTVGLEAGSRAQSLVHSTTSGLAWTRGASLHETRYRPPGAGDPLEARRKRGLARRRRARVWPREKKEARPTDETRSVLGSGPQVFTCSVQQLMALKHVMPQEP